MSTTSKAERLFKNIDKADQPFVKLYLANMAAGKGKFEAAEELWKDVTRSTQIRRTKTILNKPEVYEYLCETGQDALETLGQSMKSSIAYYIERSKSAEEILVDFVGCTIEPDDEGNLLPWIESFDDVPHMWRKYVERVKHTVDGVFLVPKELYDSKTRAKMRENLDKITGNTIERVEMLNVGVDGGKVTVSDSDNLEEVFQAYRKASK